MGTGDKVALLGRARDVHPPFGAADVLPADVAAIDAYADGSDQSIVDSGTSGLVLPKRAFEAAVATLSAAAPDVPRALWRGEACVDASKLDLSSLPELTVSLATDGEDVVLTMPACRYVNRVPKTSYCAAEAPPRKEDAYFFSVGPIEEGRNVILGQSLLCCSHVAHDMGARRGWALRRSGAATRTVAGAPARASSSLVRGGPSSPLSCVCRWARTSGGANRRRRATTRRSGLLCEEGCCAT